MNYFSRLSLRRTKSNALPFSPRRSIGLINRVTARPRRLCVRSGWALGRSIKP
jgi:hypothetical protein